MIKKQESENPILDSSKKGYQVLILWLKCYDLKLELRLHLGKDLRGVKGDCINGKV